MAEKIGNITKKAFKAKPNGPERNRPIDFLSIKDYVKYFDETCLEVIGDKEYKSNDSIRTVLNYFYGTYNFNIHDVVLNKPSLDKGLFIFGDYGTGKTVLMNIVHAMGKKLMLYHGSTCLHMMSYTAPWFTEQYMEKAKDRTGTHNFNLEHFYKGKLYIDDVGMETKAFKEIEVLADILFHRHRNEVPTYLTTNLTPSQFGERYGARIADRLPEYFNIIKFNGKSLREA